MMRCSTSAVRTFLPAPLSAAEEQEWYRPAGKPDSREAKNRLIEHNLRLVVYIAKKFDNTGVGVEDLISIGDDRSDEGDQYV